LATSDLGERERRWVDALKGAADHLVALTTLVVDAAKAEVQGIVLRNERFDLRAFVQSIADSLSARAAARRLTSATDIADGVAGTVVGDPVRLRAAVENLIDNAVKFTEAGTVGLKVTAARARGRRVRLVFAVTDSGIGMTPEEIKRLFRPFAQANADIAHKFGGAGLGLVLVKRLAKAMGGDLGVASRPGRGSTFRLSVVLAHGPGDGAAKPVDAAPAGGAPVRSLRILCAEDNPYGRVILSTILKELGHRVDFVGTGDAAVASANAGGYDLVLMDVTLPGGNGLEATRRIRALAGDTARLPVIGISGLSSADEEATARAAGMNDYLAKPVSPARLAKAIAGVMDG
jgi:CheY-like chemotaxis protein